MIKFQEHCTIHGLYDVFISKSQLERFIWILTLIGCFILATVCSKIAINEWYQSIETTNTHFASCKPPLASYIFNLGALDLPDIIICPDLLLNATALTDEIFNRTVKSDEEYKKHMINPRVSPVDKFNFYHQKKEEMKRFIEFLTLIEHKEYPNVYLPFMPRHFPKRLLELVRNGPGYEEPKMVYGDQNEYYRLREFFKSRGFMKMKYQLNYTQVKGDSSRELFR